MVEAGRTPEGRERMFGRLLPRETSFFDFFDKHAAITVVGAKEFLSLATTGANVSAKAKRIKEIEHEADSILRNAVARLFDEQADVLTVIKWKEIYENLENATDRCEDVANIIEGVVLEHA